jgi:hypothetical protein
MQAPPPCAKSSRCFCTMRIIVSRDIVNGQSQIICISQTGVYTFELVLIIYIFYLLYIDWYDLLKNLIKSYNLMSYPLSLDWVIFGNVVVVTVIF